MLKQKRKTGARLFAMLLTAVLVLASGTEVFALSSTKDNYFGTELDRNHSFYYLYNKSPKGEEEIVFGRDETTGPITMKPSDDTYRFEMRNNSGGTIKVVMGVTANVAGSVKMHISTSYGEKKTIDVSRDYAYIIENKDVKSGDSIWFECSTVSGENDAIKQDFQIRAAAISKAIGGSSSSSSSSGTKAPSDKTVVDKAPTIAVTKYSANKVNIVVTMNNRYSGRKGYSTLDIYKGSKKIKTLTSNGNKTMSYTYSAKGAASAKYKVKQTSTGNSKDTKTSKTASAKANTWKLSSYSARDISLFNGVGIHIESASYSGSTLILKGFLYNTEKSTVTEEISVAPSCGGVKLGRFCKTMKIKPGITSYTIKIKKAKVADLVNGKFIPGLGG